MGKSCDDGMHCTNAQNNMVILEYNPVRFDAVTLFFFDLQIIIF